MRAKLLCTPCARWETQDIVRSDRPREGEKTGRIWGRGASNTVALHVGLEQLLLLEPARARSITALRGASTSCYFRRTEKTDRKEQGWWTGREPHLVVLAQKSAAARWDISEGECKLSNPQKETRKCSEQMLGAKNGGDGWWLRELHEIPNGGQEREWEKRRMK